MEVIIVLAVSVAILVGLPWLIGTCLNRKDDYHVDIVARDNSAAADAIEQRQSTIVKMEKEN